MRYRGSGIGHKYMREIEEAYENMSRERMHHKEHRHVSPTGPADVNASNNSGSEDDCEPQAPTNVQVADSGTSNPPAGNSSGGGADGDVSDGSDSDYEPLGTDSGGSDSSGESDTDDFNSEGGALDDYGLGDL